MVRALRRLLAPPVFPDDDEPSRVARILARLLNLLLGVLAVGGLAAIPLLAARKLGGLAVVGALLVVLSLSRFLLHRRRIRAAAIVLVAGAWGVFTGHMALAGGPGSVVAVYYLSTPILAGLLLGRRAAALATGACLASGLVMALLEWQDLLPVPYFPLPPGISWVHLAIALVAAVVPLDLALRELAGSLETARTQARERAQAADRFQESERRYRLLFESNPHPMWVRDRETLRFLAVNNAAVQRYGYSRDEFLAMTILEIRPESDVPILLKTLAGRRAEFDESGIWRHRRKDGTLIEVEVSSHTLLFDGRPALLVLAYDVTERQQAVEALRASEERYRLLFDLESDAIFMIDNQSGDLLEANASASAMYGYSRDELLAMRNSDLSAEPEETRRVTATSRLDPAATVHVPVRLHRRKDGTVFPVEITGRFFEWRGRGVHIAAIRDITERRRSEEERRTLEAQMRHVQKLESLGVLAGGIAHDFNNLLMAILGNADLALLRLPPSAPARQNLEEIVQTSHRAADLCRQMLAYAGKGRLVIEALDLSAVVGEMVHMLQVSISKKATLRCRLAERVPAVAGDATQLRQVILNLITNASEALGDAEGVVTIATGLQHCDRAVLAGNALGTDVPEGPYVFLEVSDTGCGMDAETIPRIFDPFFSTKFTGRGLGLAAVLGIVHGHSGALKVVSAPGEGSTFTILLPAASGAAHPSQPDELPGGTWRGSGTVLLVDDEEMIRDTGREMLEWLGFRVLTAQDGQEALEVFRNSAGAVACVLLDLTMPRMNGDETFRELRRLCPDVRVILSSGYTRQEVAQRFVGQGLAGFIQKPYTVAQLREILRTALGPDGSRHGEVGSR